MEKDNVFKKIKQKNLALYGFFCIMSIQFICLFFLQWIGRILFYLHKTHYHNVSFRELIQSFSAGFQLDLAFTCYLFFVFLLFYWILFSGHSYVFRKITMVAIILISFLVCTISVIDSELFVAWGSRVNYDVFRFLKTPKEAMASTANASWFRAILLVLAGTIAVFALYRKLLPVTIGFVPSKKFNPMIFFSWIAVIILTGVGARGGLQTIPIMHSSAYFSSNRTANSGAINPGWNFVYYAFSSVPTFQLTEYDYRISGMADSLSTNFMASNLNTQKISRIDKPNVVFILLESYNAYLSKLFGGINDFTPFLDSIAQTGWYFSNMYAASNRTDKALAVMNSGWPGQPWESVLTLPDKAAKLPSLPAYFNAQGYRTDFFYGGDPNFASMGAYLHAMGYNKLTTQKDFASEDESKWGHHDEYLFKKVIEAANTTRQPFFQYMLTLSSHEPFDVPFDKIKTGGEYQALFNSVAYTDECLRKYFEFASAQSWFDNTVFILVADHGREIGLDRDEPNDKIQYKIPVIIVGKPLIESLKGKKDTRVLSQLDLPQTIVSGILGVRERVFPYSRNLMDPNIQKGAFFFFNGGFGMINANNELFSFDNGHKTMSSQTEKNDRTEENGRLGMALQYSILLKYLKL